MAIKIKAILFQELFEGLDPVFVVMGTEGEHAEGGGSLNVALAIVDEEGFLRERLLAAEHHLEDLTMGLHHTTLIAEIHRIEEIADGMTLTVEITTSPLHHKGVGVRQQTDL